MIQLKTKLQWVFEGFVGMLVYNIKESKILEKLENFQSYYDLDIDTIIPFKKNDNPSIILINKCNAFGLLHSKRLNQKAYERLYYRHILMRTWLSGFKPEFLIPSNNKSITVFLLRKQHPSSLKKDRYYYRYSIVAGCQCRNYDLFDDAFKKIYRQDIKPFLYVTLFTGTENTQEKEWEEGISILNKKEFNDCYLKAIQLSPLSIEIESSMSILPDPVVQDFTFTRKRKRREKAVR